MVIKELCNRFRAQVFQHSVLRNKLTVEQQCSVLFRNILADDRTFETLWLVFREERNYMVSKADM